MSEKKGKKSARLVTGAVPLRVHLEALKQSNDKYLKDTGKSQFNIDSGEGSAGAQTQAGYELAKKSKVYYFRNPGRNRSEREAGAVQPAYIKEEKMDKGRDQVVSGDIKISKRRKAFEEAIAPRVEKIEQEYFANKAAAGKEIKFK
jgi:hypothetical protein